MYVFKIIYFILLRNNQVKKNRNSKYVITFFNTTLMYSGSAVINI